MRGRNDDAVGEAGLAAAVIGEDGVRNRRGRGVFISGRNHDLDAVCGEHLEGAGESRRGERVRIEPDEQRTLNPLLPPVLADGLADREHVPFVETRVERAAAVAGSAEADPL